MSTGCPRSATCCAMARSCTTLAEAVGKTFRALVQSETSASTPVQDHDGVTLPMETEPATRTLRTRILVNAEGGLYRSSRNAAAPAARATMVRRRSSVRSAYRRHNRTSRGNASRPRADCAAADRRRARRRLRARLVLTRKKRPAARNCPDANSCANSAPPSASGWAASRRSKDGRSFPLGLNALDTLVKGTVAAIGNAAQTLHPVAGQGLNLGYATRTRSPTRSRQHGATPLALSLVRPAPRTRPAPDDPLHRYARASFHGRLRALARCAGSP
jgi:2-octaprenyl-6-methoxyphenol hydroxylase